MGNAIGRTFLRPVQPDLSHIGPPPFVPYEQIEGMRRMGLNLDFALVPYQMPRLPAAVHAPPAPPEATAVVDVQNVMHVRKATLKAQPCAAAAAATLKKTKQDGSDGKEQQQQQQQQTKNSDDSKDTAAASVFFRVAFTLDCIVPCTATVLCHVSGAPDSAVQSHVCEFKAGAGQKYVTPSEHAFELPASVVALMREQQQQQQTEQQQLSESKEQRDKRKRAAYIVVQLDSQHQHQEQKNSEASPLSDVVSSEHHVSVHQTLASLYIAPLAKEEAKTKKNGSSSKHAIELRIKSPKQRVTVNGAQFELMEIYGLDGLQPQEEDEEEAADADGTTSDQKQSAAAAAATAKQKKNDKPAECVICMSVPPDTAILPCRHLCLCRECCVELLKQTDIQGKRCPLCRKPIASTLLLAAAV
jgi:hypothetical protein